MNTNTRREAKKRWKDKEMYSGIPRKAKIIKCTNQSHWHINSIGKNIMVMAVSWASAYMEAENGFSIPESDIKLLN